MPYVDRKERALLDAGLPPNTPGELNYLMTCLALKYMRRKGLSYQTINDILGAFQGASLEFYRRIAVDYESKKIAENGDVY